MGDAPRINAIQYKAGAGKPWQKLALLPNQKVEQPQDQSGVRVRVTAKSNWAGFPTHFERLEIVYEQTWEKSILKLVESQTGTPMMTFSESLKLTDKTPQQIQSHADGYKDEMMLFVDSKTDEKIYLSFDGQWRITYINPSAQEIPMIVKSVDPDQLIYKAYFGAKPNEIYTFKLDEDATSMPAVYTLSLTNPDGSKQTFIGAN